jgi:hypothetical protein
VEGCGEYVEIYNAVGKLVKQAKAQGAATIITINQPSGIYFIRTNRQTVQLIIRN